MFAVRQRRREKKTVKDKKTRSGMGCAEGNTPQNSCAAPSFIISCPAALPPRSWLDLEAVNTMLQDPDGDFTRLPSPGWGGRPGETGIGNGRDAAQPPKPGGHWWSAQTAWVLSPSPGSSSAPKRHRKPAHVSASRKDGLVRRQPNSRVLLGVLVGEWTRGVRLQ